MNTNVMYTIIGDLAVNLSAGWLGGLIIIPVKSGKPLKYKVRSLILNLVVIVFLLITAYKFYSLTL